MKKQITITAISVALVLMLGLGFLFGVSECFTDWNTNTWFKATAENKIPVSDNELHVIPNETENMKLTVGKMTPASAENGYTKSVTLTASVFPADVLDKSVDWTIEWFDESIELDLSEYVTILPESDGSLTATVTCKKPFNSDVLVTVTTRVGKVFATCRVIYEGAPTSILITENDISAIPHDYIGSYYGLYTGSTYTFDLTPFNEFGDVRQDCNYTVSLSAVGNITVQDYVYNGINETRTWVEGTQAKVAISSITQISSVIATNAFECSVSDNKLSVKSNATLNGYYASSKRVGQIATYYGKFKEFENDNWYYTVTVTETNSGASGTVKLRPFASINSIDINSVVIAF